MTRTDVLTLGRRQQTGTQSTRRGPHRQLVSLRRLLVLPVALLLAVAPATPALAASSTSKEGLSGYKHTESAKKETLPTTSKKEPEPTKEVEPTKEAAPATSEKASTLPFTGFDLRWTVGFGILLMGAGGSIVLMQRRTRRSGGR